MHTNWKDRLHNWAPEPPNGGWERLSEALPHEDKPAYAQKLHDFSAAPPPHVWAAVANGLEEAQPETNVIQMYPRKRWLQVASIAASLLLAAYLLPSLFETGQQSTATSPAPAVQQGLAPAPQQYDQQDAATTEDATIVTASSAKKTAPAYFAELPLPPKSNEPLPMAKTERSNSVLRSWLPESDGLQPIDDRMERYIVLAVADDAAIRLPKKLYGAFRCDEHPDPAGCLEQLSALRRQLASPAQLASADFLGVLEVVRNMAVAQ